MDATVLENLSELKYFFNNFLNHSAYILLPTKGLTPYVLQLEN